MHVAGIAFVSAAPLQWGSKEQAADFFDVKADVEALLAPAVPQFEAAEHPAMHPGRCAKVLVHGHVVGHVGELHPRWRQSWDLTQAPVMFELSLEAVLHRDVPKSTGVAKFPNVERDIAVIVKDSVTHAQLMAAVHGAKTQGLLRNAVLFDVYRPKADSAAMAMDEKSLAVRLTLNSDEATLNEAQIEGVVQAVVAELTAQLSARLRA
jgi:phenylalanyl-tRNA synthetase beta chain